MNNTIHSIYNNSPAWLQNIYCTSYGTLKNNERQGNEFYKYYYYLIKNEFNSCEEINNNQERNLKEIINYSILNNSYYQDKFKKFDFDKQNFFESIKNLPILTKEDIYKNERKLISLNTKSKLLKLATSGTTGKALNFYTTKTAVAFQWAVWWRYRRRFNFLPNQWHVNFTGKPVVRVEQMNPPFWRLDFARKQVIICASQLTNEKIKYIVDFLNNKKILVFTGYPSIVSQFCELLINNSLSLDYKPALVTLGAEKCFEFQKQIISRVTGAFVTDQYGNSEGCANASKCLYGNYHEDSEYSYLECLDRVNNSDGSYTGKILATGFSNNAFPFIRYLTGDTAKWAPENFKCPCGRKSKVLLNIEGRLEDYIKTSDGIRL